MLDYIIVGAGVAGCRIAHHLDDLSLDYLVVEAKRDPGIKDSGIVSDRIFSLYEHIPVKARESEMVVKGRSEESIVEIPGGVVVMERERFGREIRKGLDISYDRISSVRKIAGGYELGGRETYRAKRIIAADGTASAIRSSFSIHPPPFLPALFTFSRPGRGIEVLFDKSLSNDFFAWRSIDEYGLADRDISGKLELLLDRFNANPGDMYSGLIPIMSVWPVYGDVILLGDAAGMTKPVTGGGIIYSTMAADILASLIERGREREFGRAWMRNFRREQLAGYLFRRIYPHLPQAVVDVMVSAMGTEDMERFDYDFLTTFAFQLLKKPFKRLWKS